MASFYSKPADYGTYTQPINLELVNFVMQSKQQKYDYNLAKLESKINDQLGSIDLVRTQDKEYFLNRASQVVNAMGDISKMDLSQNGVTKQIDSNLNAIIDDQVMESMISTKNYRNFQSKLQQRQSKNPELYSTLNAAYAMEKGGVNSWLKGDLNSLSPVQYEDFTDVSSELKDISENLHKHARVIKKFTADGFYFVSQEGEVLTSSEVKSIAEQQLSDKAKRQMQINGWGNYDAGQRSFEEISSTFDAFKKDQFKGIDSNINKLQLQLDNLEGTDADTTAEIANRIDQLKDYKNKLSTRYNEWKQKGNADSMTSTMEKERVLNRFGETFSINNLGDPVYSANNVALQLEKMRFQAAQKERELLAKQTQEISDLQIIDVQSELSPIDQLSDTLTKASEYESSYKNKTNALFGTLSKEHQDAIDSNYDESSGISKEEHRYLEMEKLLSQNNNIITNKAFKQIEEDKLRFDRFNKDYNDSIKFGLEVSENSNLNAVVADYFSNKRVEMVDENGNVIGVGEYLKSKGIRNGDDLNKEENAAVKVQVLKSYYADKLLSKGILQNLKDSKEQAEAEAKASGSSFTFGTFNMPGIRDLIADESFTEDKEDLLFMERLIELSGSEEEAQKFLAASREGKTFDRAEVNYGINLIYQDDSVTDDAVLNNWIDFDNIEKHASTFLNEKTQEGRGVGIAVPTKSAIGLQLLQLANSPEATLGNTVTFKEADGQSVTVTDVNPDVIQLSGTKVVEGKDVPVATRILKANIPPQLLAQVNFNPQRAIFDKSNMVEVEQRVQFKNSADSKSILDIATTFTGGDIESALMTTKEKNLDVLRLNFPEVMGTTVQPSIVGSAVEEMLNSNNIKVKIKEIDGDFYNEIVIINPVNQREEVLDASLIPIDESDYDGAYRQTKRAPQFYISKMLQDNIAQMSVDPTNPTPVIQKLLKYYGGN